MEKILQAVLAAVNGMAEQMAKMAEAQQTMNEAQQLMAQTLEAQAKVFDQIEASLTKVIEGAGEEPGSGLALCPNCGGKTPDTYLFLATSSSDFYTPGYDCACESLLP